MTPTPHRVNRDAYAEYKRRLWQRCQGRCERPGCGAPAHDPHHVRKPRRRYHRYIVALCRSCHTWVDAPRLGTRGRLSIELEEYAPGDPVLIYRFTVSGGPMHGWEQSAVLPTLGHLP
jgi:plasmid stabilization system protein ParE